MGAADPDIERTARRWYAAGLIATLLLAIAGQLLLRSLPAGGQDSASIREIGYTFTGICMLGALLLARRGRTGATPKGRPPAVLARSIRRAYAGTAGACAVSAGFGFLYWVLGGSQVERYARTYLALGPAAFLVLARRPRSWTEPTGGRA